MEKGKESNFKVDMGNLCRRPCVYRSMSSTEDLYNLNLNAMAFTKIVGM
jgi:hypothetical protein